MSMIMEERSKSGVNSSVRSELCTDILRDLFTDYFKYTNLDGHKYSRNKNNTIVRCFWLVIFICCAMLCIVFTSKLWMKWNETSLVIMNADTLVPVHQIPFPAVTVCIETKSMSSKYSFTDNYHLYNDSETRANMSDYDRNMFEDLTLVCDSHLNSAIGRNFSDPKDVLSNLRTVAPDINEAFFVCKWKHDVVEGCADYFTQILTEEGICYTFNMLASDDIFKRENLHKEYRHIDDWNKSLTLLSWSLESGYSTTEESETYPKRGSGYGEHMGLSFLIKQNKDDLDYLCRGPVQGSKVILHNPAEFPIRSRSYFRTSVNEESIISVKPKMITTSKALRSYSPERRQCYFSDERYLHYFKVYTQSNCEIECLANYTYAKCGCVHIGMPRGPDMKVCNTGKVECMNEARNKFMESELDAFLGEGEVRHCDCLPSCTSIEYESETSQANYDFKALCKAYRLGIDDGIQDNLLMSRIKVFFKSPQFIASQRREMYGAIDFLADCGGIIGLFMGISLLGFINLLYFIISRVYYVFIDKNKRTDSEYYENAADLNSQT